jgi:CcmD family protein
MDNYFKDSVDFIERKKDDVMTQLKKITGSFLLLLLSASVFAQDKKEVMADTMRSNGRIYVVVAVLTTILIGLLLYVFRLDRKIRKLEKEK